MNTQSIKRKKKSAKTKIVTWVKTHEHELIAAGLSIASILTFIYGIRRKEDVIKYWTSLKSIVAPHQKKATVVKHLEITQMPADCVMPVSQPIAFVGQVQEMNSTEVSKHLRRLHEGWHASQEKINTARANGYELKPGETWVASYTKGLRANQLVA